MSDPRIAAGMVRQLARRPADAPIRGWKVAFPTPAAQRNAGVDQPLVAWLTSATERPGGATIDVTGWTKPTVEAELAIHLATDVAPGSTLEQAAAAIGAISAAIEVVDLDRPASEIEDVAADGLFHRAYVLGTPRTGTKTDDVTVTGDLDGTAYAANATPTETIGTPPQVARFVADELARHGERLAAGQIVLAGSALPLQPVGAGQRLTVDAGPLGALTLLFA